MVARGVTIKDLKNKAISSPREEERGEEAMPGPPPAALPSPSVAAAVANEPSPAEPVKLAAVPAPPQKSTSVDLQTVFNVFCITALFFCFVFLILIYAQLCKISHIMERVIFSNRR